MNTATQHQPALKEYVDLPGLMPKIEHTLPTVQSVAWYVRSHREQLAEAGALIYVAGRLRYHPELFQRYVAETGRTAAKRSK